MSTVNPDPTEEPDTDSEVFQLYISQGSHATRPGPRIKEITEATESLDVVFAENAMSNPPNLRTRLTNFISAPLLVATIHLWTMALTLWGRITGLSDQKIINHLEEHYQAEVIQADKNLHRIIEEQLILWSCGHGIIVLISFLAISSWFTLWETPIQTIGNALLSLSPPVSQSLIIWGVLLGAIFGLFLTAGFGMFSLFVAGSFSARNHEIVDIIERYAEQNAGKKGCLVIGGFHGEPIKSLIHDSEYVQVADLKESEE